MIDIYTANTPNGVKIPIAMEELGEPYRLHRLNLGKRDQKAPDYLKINPNGRIPAIVDPNGPKGEPLSVFESGAILQYLAEKFGRLLPTDPVDRIRAIEYLNFQVAGIGPMFGQAGWFMRSAPEPMPLAVQRYVDEGRRLTAVLEERLTDNAWLAGDTYSIADIATFGWLRVAPNYGIELSDFPHVAAWVERVGARPAVQKGLAVTKGE